MTSYIQLMQRQLHREFVFNCREPRQVIYSCLFFLMVLVFFPLTISTEITTLRMLAPGLIWIATLFSFFLSSEQLFWVDYQEGVIEQWLASGHPLSLLVMAKISMHWCLTLLPILIISPMICFLFDLNFHELIVLMLGLICGSPAIMFLCGLAAAFGTGTRQKGVLMALIVFPLTIPVLIFGSQMLTAAMHDEPVQGYLALLLAFSVIAVGLLPMAVGAVVAVCLAE